MDICINLLLGYYVNVDIFTDFNPSAVSEYYGHIAI